VAYIYIFSAPIYVDLYGTKMSFFELSAFNSIAMIVLALIFTVQCYINIILKDTDLFVLMKNIFSFYFAWFLVSILVIVLVVISKGDTSIYSHFNATFVNYQMLHPEVRSISEFIRFGYGFYVLIAASLVLFANTIFINYVIQKKIV